MSDKFANFGYRARECHQVHVSMPAWAEGEHGSKCHFLCELQCVAPGVALGVIRAGNHMYYLNPMLQPAVGGHALPGGRLCDIRIDGIGHAQLIEYVHGPAPAFEGELEFWVCDFCDAVGKDVTDLMLAAVLEKKTPKA